MAVSKCDSCVLIKTPLIFVSMNRKLCSQCFSMERKNLKSLIKSLPNIKPKNAPLGHNWIECEYFRDEKLALHFIDQIFSMPIAGVKN